MEFFKKEKLCNAAQENGKNGQNSVKKTKFGLSGTSK